MSFKTVTIDAFMPWHGLQYVVPQDQKDLSLECYINVFDKGLPRPIDTKDIFIFCERVYVVFNADTGRYRGTKSIGFYDKDLQPLTDSQLQWLKEGGYR